MAITLIDAVNGTTIVSSDYNANNSTIESALNSIDGGDIQSSSVPNSALSNSESQVFLTKGVTGAGSQTFYIPIPFTQDVIFRGYRWHISDAGTASGGLTIRDGTFSSGTFSAVSNIVSGVIVASTGVDGQDNTGGNTLINVTVPSTSTVIEVTFTAGTAQSSAATDSFTVTLYGVTELTT